VTAGLSDRSPARTVAAKDSMKEISVNLVSAPSQDQPAGRVELSGPPLSRPQSARRSARSALNIDRSTPALTLKIGQYPVHSGGVAAIRTLGRLGVPVYAITEFGLTPAAVSRYCSGRFPWRATGSEQPDQLVADLCEVGRRIGRLSVVIPVDDEAAILVAEHEARLTEFFLFPQVRLGLPRELASKYGLFELCRSHGVPAPGTVAPASLDELAAFAATATFPVVVKNAEAWVRRRHPVVPGTTVLRSAEELLALVQATAADGEESRGERHGGALGIVAQEYLPPEQSEDWIVQLYSDAESNCAVLFTGQKIRSWPPNAGVTACAYSVVNSDLGAAAERFCREIGFRGIADLDWRFDRRDGQYKLVDFNPRAGNQFRLFETEAGVDVVRALHLDLTGRGVPGGRQVENRRIIVEHVDLPARLAYRRLSRRAQPGQPVMAIQPAQSSEPGQSAEPGHSMRPGQLMEPGQSTGHGRRAEPGQPAESGQSGAPGRKPITTELAWLAMDDPLPFLAMLCRVAGPAAAGLARILRPAARRTPAARKTSAPGNTQETQRQAGLGR